jgi:hypothetical protein
MITRDDIRIQVVDSLQEWAGDYDVEGIIDEIVTTYGLVDIDTIDPYGPYGRTEPEHAPYWAIVERHDLAARRADA